MYHDVQVVGGLTAQEVRSPSNTWGTGPTSRTEQKFSNSSAMTLETCPNGHYVCAVGAAHTSGDSQYYTGARLQIRCCSL